MSYFNEQWQWGFAVSNIFLINNRRQLILLLMLFSWSSYGESIKDEVRVLYLKHDQGLLDEKAKLLLGQKIDGFIISKDFTAAEKLVQDALKDKKVPKEILNYYLLKLAIYKSQAPTIAHYLPLLSQVFARNTGLMAELYQDLPADKRSALVINLAQADFFTAPHSACPFFELNARKIRADFLFAMAKNAHIPKPFLNRALYELYVLKPEVINVEDLKRINGFNDFFQTLKSSDLAQRMDLLLSFGKNNEARFTFNESQALVDKPEERCELSYLDAKVDRQQKKYSQARQRFTEFAKSCPNVAKKARFMTLMLKSMSSDDSDLEQFQAFVNDYKNDSLVDDVLMFKANLLFEKNLQDQALATLEQIITEYPTGDIIHRALFLKALSMAKLARTEEALTVLKQLKNISAQGGLDYAAAEYWSLRLQIFQDIYSLSAPNLKNGKAIKNQLRNLVFADTKTVYSWLALSLLESLGEKIQVNKAAPVKRKSVSIAHAELSFIKQLVDLGFRKQALSLLQELVPTSADLSSQMAVLYDALNRKEYAHHQLIRCNKNLADGLLQKNPQLFHDISYPRPFLQETTAALKNLNLPIQLVTAVMGKESGFFERARSWADARGLMQLIKTSAAAQAKSLGLVDFKEEDLYRADINIALGSSLLHKYLQQFGHLAVALCAYNAGPTAARKWLTKNNHAPLDVFIADISYKETRNYVQSVLGSTFQYMVEDGIMRGLPLTLAKAHKP